ncbi:hypothetical protein KAX17_18830 [Candidatus Bipolaricaulota bacterium]|nr:hypothetical protein [Candidatus Bipolaricaulota bacterium]
MSKVSTIEERLWNKAEQYIQSLRGVREPKIEDIFTRRYYISPQDLLIMNYLRTQPVAAFNPGALERGGKLLIFPRLVFDYYSYASSIGVFELDLERLFQGRIEKPLKAKIVLWPKELWEFGHGCEDPRVSLFNNSIYMLYTGAGRHYEGEHMVEKSAQGFAELGPAFEIKKKGYFSIVNGDDRFVSSMKDCALIEVERDRATMLTRPDFRGIALCWRAEADLETLTIREETLGPVLTSEEWEHKVGWSTNTIKLSENEYLVGWHGVLKEDLSYRNGLAIVDGSGDLLAISNYLLAPKGLEESYGDRPLVIFGDGLVRHENYLIWIGGISDYAIGIFIAELDEALEKLKRIK